jgi:hypothetical protein
MIAEIAFGIVIVGLAVLCVYVIVDNYLHKKENEEDDD